MSENSIWLEIEGSNRKSCSKQLSIFKTRDEPYSKDNSKKITGRKKKRKGKIWQNFPPNNFFSAQKVTNPKRKKAQTKVINVSTTFQMLHK